jgi:hypothetical protein
MINAIRPKAIIIEVKKEVASKAGYLFTAFVIMP